ncbi:unnamed protein product, partial [Ectocarpus sp. 13 AM-2016]
MVIYCLLVTALLRSWPSLVTQRWLSNNNLTTLPEEIFGDLTALTLLNLDGNSLECLPSNELVEADDDSPSSAFGLHVNA